MGERSPSMKPSHEKSAVAAAAGATKHVCPQRPFQARDGWDGSPFFKEAPFLLPISENERPQVEDLILKRTTHASEKNTPAERERIAVLACYPSGPEGTTRPGGQICL